MLSGDEIVPLISSRPYSITSSFTHSLIFLSTGYLTGPSWCPFLLLSTPYHLVSWCRCLCYSNICVFYCLVTLALYVTKSATKTISLQNNQPCKQMAYAEKEQCCPRRDLNPSQPISNVSVTGANHNSTARHLMEHETSHDIDGLDYSFTPHSTKLPFSQNMDVYK